MIQCDVGVLHRDTSGLVAIFHVAEGEKVS